MKITINNTDVEVTHAVKIGLVNSQTAIHVTATVGDTTHDHVITVGTVDQPLPVDYNLQVDVDKARCAGSKCITFQMVQGTA